MGKTADLRKLITSTLDSLPGKTYHKKADVGAVYPYKVYTLRSVNLGDLSRCDYVMEVDIWDLNDDPKRAEEIADQMEELLNAANLPQDTILPTFFRETAGVIEDPDKTIQRLKLIFQIQLYTT